MIFPAINGTDQTQLLSGSVTMNPEEDTRRLKENLDEVENGFDLLPGFKLKREPLDTLQIHVLPLLISLFKH